MSQPITEIQNKSTVTVSSISASSELVESLSVLGFTPGTRATLISKSPFYGPLAIELRGSRVAIRHEDAAHIMVD